MIDAHTHILPGMDDGSKSVEESVEMLHLEWQHGIDTVVMTPHFYAFQNNPQAFLKRREAAWNRLKPALTPDMPGILLGAEVQYFEGICQVPDLHDLCIQGTDLLLLEMPQQKWSDRILNDVLELHDRENMTVLLAHIERFLDCTSKDNWAYLRRCGVQMQVSAAWFLSWKTAGKAKRMMKRGDIQLLGSDTHNLTSRRPNLKAEMAKYGPLSEELIPRHLAYKV